MSGPMALPLIWLTGACGNPDPTPPAEPEPVEAPAPDARRVPPAAPDGLVPVEVVGHGLRIRIHPPFQLGMMDVPGDGTGPPLVLSWWDVSDPTVGALGGQGGLHNSIAMPGPSASGDATIRKVDHAARNGRTVVRYQLGETGSYVQLAPSLGGAGGMLTVEPGPAEAGWWIVEGGQRTAIELKTFVHSADPASGSAVEITRAPHQPWGPWPEGR
ncbi:MAG: hypothetical protein AAF211_10095 [Myxococcota bacterium]